MTTITNVVGLAAQRQVVLNGFGDTDNEATDLANMERLNEIEAQIESAEFNTDAEKLAGLMILFEQSDGPNFADQFKAKLFSRIHQFG